MALFFATLLILCATKFIVGAAVRETNGQRMSRGLGPLPPRWMPTRAQSSDTANQPSASPSPGAVLCRADGVPLCCTSAVSPSDPTAAFLLELLTAPEPDSGLVAITCSRLGRRKCARNAVCCNNDTFDGVIATGCTAVGRG
ncbi:hypothetical protein C8R45DRAFT_480842 [Mycena sanguinolenta]|nr:hypothetical protein C8R45DRAFT_480842 [Mycena sanguinolenta]